MVKQREHYEVVPVGGTHGADSAHYGICLHADCQTEDGRSAYRKKRGSAGQAEAAVLDHLRDRHGIGRG